MTYHILVIDDESVTRRLVTHALKSLSIEVLGAEDGKTALALAQQSHLFDLAIVDINLPDIDGFTIIRRLRQLPHMQNVPMIIFTARDYAGDETKALEVGAVNFLYKPFSMQTLRDMVAAHLHLA